MSSCKISPDRPNIPETEGYNLLLVLRWPYLGAGACLGDYAARPRLTPDLLAMMEDLPPAPPPLPWLRSDNLAGPCAAPGPTPWVSPAVPLLLSQSETVLTTYETKVDWKHLPCARSSRLLEAFS